MHKFQNPPMKFTSTAAQIESPTSVDATSERYASDKCMFASSLLMRISILDDDQDTIFGEYYIE